MAKSRRVRVLVRACVFGALSAAAWISGCSHNSDAVPPDATASSASGASSPAKVNAAVAPQVQAAIQAGAAKGRGEAEAHRAHAPAAGASH